MERSEAEAVYDAGRERCVDVIVGLAGEREQFAARCERLEERVARLEEQARIDSSNSSRPPSQDPPASRAERRAAAREKAKRWARGEGERKPGAQPGHEGCGRKLLSEDQLDEIVEHYPAGCEGCGHEFSEEEREISERFGRHQVADLPPIAVIWCEHRTHRLRCPCCGKRTTAKLPPEVGDSLFGPGLQATVVSLTARNRVSRRDMAELSRPTCSAFPCRSERSMRSCSAPPWLCPSRMSGSSQECSAPRRSTSTRRAGSPRTSSARAVDRDHAWGGHLPDRGGSSSRSLTGFARQGLQGDRELGSLVGV